MKREIKFRAWDSEKNRMIFNAECTNFYQQLDPEDPEEFDFGDFILDKKRFTLLQYTGLKDKNGVEIYEGDIVEFLYKHPEMDGMLVPVRCTIKWSDEGAWCLLWNTKDKYENGARLSPEKYTVVGNIYENPDSL